MLSGVFAISIEFNINNIHRKRNKINILSDKIFVFFFLNNNKQKIQIYKRYD